MRKRDVAADIAPLGESRAGTLRSSSGGTASRTVVAVDSVALQPEAMDVRRARMRDRPADDEGLSRHSTMPSEAQERQERQQRQAEDGEEVALDPFEELDAAAFELIRADARQHLADRPLRDSVR